MALPATTEKRLLCPSCGNKGKPVTPVTLHALLKDPHGEGIAASEQSRCGTSGNGEPGCKPASGDTGWRYCDSRDCDVVYFATDSDSTFTKPQLKVAVGVKEATGERPLCYCFGHSVASIKNELQAKGRSDALEDIRRRMKAPGCRCAVTNPSGSCCLGSVASGIEIAREESGMGVSQKAQPGADPDASSGSRGEKIAKIGTVVSAIVASSCCWLPLVLLAVGVSGVGIAATMEAFRPLFIVVTFGFLAAAIYFTYRPRKASAESGATCCAPEPSEKTGDCCAPAGKRGFNMTTMNKIMLWVVSALAVAFVLFPHYIGLFLVGGNGAVEPNNPLVRTTAFTVEGMTCEGCSAVVEKVIRNVPGVLSVKVDYDKKLATVTTEECCPVPNDAIINALQKAGYGSAVVERPAPAGTDTTDLKAGCCEMGRCESPPAADNGKTDTGPIDPDRQIIFTVEGFT